MVGNRETGTGGEGRIAITDVHEGGWWWYTGGTVIDARGERADREGKASSVLERERERGANKRPPQQQEQMTSSVMVNERKD